MPATRKIALVTLPVRKRKEFNPIWSDIQSQMKTVSMANKGAHRGKRNRKVTLKDRLTRFPLQGDLIQIGEEPLELLRGLPSGVTSQRLGWVLADRRETAAECREPLSLWRVRNHEQARRRIPEASG